ARPFFGAMLSPTQMVLSGGPVSTTRWTGRDAGLRPRDVVTHIDGQALSSPGDYATARRAVNAYLDSAKTGQRIEVVVREQGGISRTVTYRLSNFPTGDFLVYFIIPFLAGVIAWGAGMVIFFWRGYQPSALLSAALCACIGLLLAGVFDQSRDGLLAPLWMIGTALTGGIAVTLGFTFPSTLPIVYRVPALRFLPMALSAVAGMVAAVMYLNPSAPFDVAPATVIVIAAAVGGAFIFFLLMRVQRRRAVNRAVRDQSGLVLTGLALSTIPGFVWLAGQIIHAF